jgi:hypothetical protein
MARHRSWAVPGGLFVLFLMLQPSPEMIWICDIENGKPGLDGRGSSKLEAERMLERELSKMLTRVGKKRIDEGIKGSCCRAWSEGQWRD